MTLIMNQLLDSKLTKDDEQEEKNNQPIEKKEEDALFLWDCVSLFDTEEEGSLKQEETSKTNVTTRSQGLLNKDNLILPKIKKFQENMKKIQMTKYMNLPLPVNIQNKSTCRLSLLKTKLIM